MELWYSMILLKEKYLYCTKCQHGAFFCDRLGFCSKASITLDYGGWNIISCSTLPVSLLIGATSAGESHENGRDRRNLRPGSRSGSDLQYYGTPNTGVRDRVLFLFQEHPHPSKLQRNIRQEEFSYKISSSRTAFPILNRETTTRPSSVRSTTVVSSRRTQSSTLAT